MQEKVGKLKEIRGSQAIPYPISLRNNCCKTLLEQTSQGDGEWSVGTMNRWPKFVGETKHAETKKAPDLHYNGK